MHKISLYFQIRPVSTIGSVSDYDGLAQLSGGCGFEPRAGQLFDPIR